MIKIFTKKTAITIINTSYMIEVCKNLPCPTALVKYILIFLPTFCLYEAFKPLTPPMGYSYIKPNSQLQIPNSYFISSTHLSLSSGLNFQGAKLFSILLNMAFHSCGALLSSIIKERRSSIIISSGEIETGHSSTQALQVVQARSSSTVI